MRLQAGDEHPWPSQPHRIDGGEVLLILVRRTPQGVIDQRHPLITLGPGMLLPAHPSAGAIELECRFRALQACTLTPLSPSEVTPLGQGSEELIALLQHGVDAVPSNNAEQGLATLLQRHWEVKQRLLQERLNSTEELDAGRDLALFRLMEQASGAPAAADPQSLPLHDPMQACVQQLLRAGTAAGGASLVTNSPGNPEEPRRRLHALLTRNGLIGRDVVLQGDLRQQDCGDLIGFLSHDPQQTVLLQSRPNGYQIWIPGAMAQPLPLAQQPELMAAINPRVVAVSPAFARQDLNAIGLLRFAYGEPKHQAAFLIGGLLLGLALGLLLAIGREVGAARWIFGMGFTGLAMGASLGLLSGGFRIGVSTMLIATLLGLLTPTFNTVITNQALPDRDLGLLLQMAVILILAGVLRVALEWTQSQSLLLPQQQGAARSQFASIQRLLSLPIDFYRQYNMGDLLLRFRALDDLRDEVQKLLDGGLLKVVLTSIYILFLLKISVKLTVLAMVIAGMMLIPTAVIALQSRPLLRRQEEIDGQAQSRNLELISSVPKLRLAGAETRAARWWAQHYQRSIVLEEALDAKEAIGQLLGSIIPNLGTLLLYIVITKLIAEAADSPSIQAPNTGQLLGFFSAFATFIGAMSSFSELLIGAFDLPVIFERAKPILTVATEQNDQLVDADHLQGGLQFDRVSYRYAPQLPLVLDGVSFEAKPGDFIALVGPSGSGKSTLVRLMLGFARPENGTVLYDGQPLNGLRLDSVRRQIGTVLQSSAVFSGSLFEAIAGGCLISLDEAWEAAAMAGLADDIQAMPMGMQTVIPDGGGTLSGGQRQRIAIARALVRKPRLLIFDEATSALDNKTQATVSQSLEALAITRVVIAHRLSTVRQADQILVLQRGQVMQRGRFDHLMAEPGLFAELMERQIA